MGTGLLLAAVVVLLVSALLILAREDAAEAPLPVARGARAAPVPEGLSPREFERHCADLLAARGWSVVLGRGSADQGVDVLARKGGRSVVLQCKLHTRPVGNKAVQEALAGRGFAGADHAAVVSTSAYTPAARALASRVGVLLLQASDLSRADALFRGGAAVAEAPPRVRAVRGVRRGRFRPGWWGLVPGALLVAFILLVPGARRGPEEGVRPLRSVSRAPLPLPLPAPPGVPRRGAG